MLNCSAGKKGLEEIILDINKTRGKVGGTVSGRLEEFRANSNWFSEMCFCILTANYTAEGGIRIQEKIPDFSVYSAEETEKILRKFGHRFPKTRAGFLYEAGGHKEKLGKLRCMGNSSERREWLVKNVKGLGYKEASHFLRNIGYFDVAVIDRHIIAVLVQYGLIEPPKTLTRKRYLEIESLLGRIAELTGASLGELDLYLWFMKTGKVLK